MRSYTVSTGRHRQPGGRHVTRRVDITIVAGAAPARPRPHVQRHPLNAGTQLGRGEPAVHHQITSMPWGFVFQQSAELPPGRVTDGTGQAVVLDHGAHGQVLDHDRVVLTNEPSSHLVRTVTATVIAQQRHEPTACRVVRHRHRRRARAAGQRTRPPDRQRLIQFGRAQRPVAPPERAAGVLRRPPRLLPTPARRVPGAFAPEIGEPDLQVPQRPRLATGLRRQVADQPGTPGRPAELSSLPRGRVEAVPERPLPNPGHSSHPDKPTSEPLGDMPVHADPPWRRISVPCLAPQGFRFLSSLKAGVSAKGIR
ncbi:hypothetical protein H4W33_009242 [Kibdelosporangium phytohabitans]|nr:hypothetical protein [Kibdelosporangium phytohabitans]